MLIDAHLVKTIPNLLKIVILCMNIVLFPSILNSQNSKSNIKWKAEVMKIKNNIFDLKFTVLPTEKWHTVSVYQDTNENYILPIEVNFTKNQYFETLQKLIERPIVKMSIHKSVGVGRWIKSKTTYTQRIKLLTRKSFKSSCYIQFPSYSDKSALPFEKIYYEINYTQNQLIIKELLKTPYNK
jgi:hypothetical protein